MKLPIYRPASVALGAMLVAATILASHLNGDAEVVSQGSIRPVIMISIDGLRPDYITEADRYGLMIPNLRRMLKVGSHASGVRGVVPTVTYPSHATLVTGVAPSKHGIHSNTTFDPLGKNQGGWYWYASDFQVPTLWDVAASRGLKVASVHWPVTVGARIDWNIPQYWRTGMADDRKLVAALSTPGLLDSLERDLGPYADGIDESIEGDERRARFVTHVLKTRRPALTLAYFTALDHAQHDYGPATPEARATLERIDRIVGDVWGAAVDASSGRAVIVVVSDHGFAKVDKALNLGVAFAKAGLITLGADQKPVSWRAMPWGAGASAAIVLADSAPASTREQVRSLLSTLAADRANGIDTIVDAAGLRQAGGFPTAAFYVSLKPGFTMGSSMTGSVITPATVRGMHGYLNTLPDMRSSFFIAGPGIPAGQSLGEIDMRNIAPTVAAILNLTLPTAQGRTVFPELVARP